MPIKENRGFRGFQFKGEDIFKYLKRCPKLGSGTECNEIHPRRPTKDCLMIILFKFKTKALDLKVAELSI